jgi:hypothetical protein
MEIPSPFEDHVHISAKALSGQSGQAGNDNWRLNKHHSVELRAVFPREFVLGTEHSE